MRTFRRLAAALLLLGIMLAAPVVLARATVPVIERPDVAVVTGSGKPASNEAVRQAIVSAGAAAQRRWSVVPAGDGRTLKATYTVRKHTIVVDIVPGSRSYSVKYADSTNMNYSLDRGTPLIHPNYNQWVDQLIQAIGIELRKL